MGLAPFTNNFHGEKEQNFMWMLKNQSMIDHNVFSIYTDPYYQSTIKFGSMDTSAFQNNRGHSLAFTYNSSMWAIPIQELYIGSDHYGQMIYPSEITSRLATFEPMMPYLYVPQQDFYEIAGIFRNMYGFELCDKDAGVCYFNQKCEHITTVDDEVMNHTLYVAFPDEAANMTFESRRMFIRGSQIDSTDDRCYVPIFMHQ